MARFFQRAQRDGVDKGQVHGFTFGYSDRSGSGDRSSNDRRGGTAARVRSGSLARNMGSASRGLLERADVAAERRLGVDHGLRLLRRRGLLGRCGLFGRCGLRRFTRRSGLLARRHGFLAGCGRLRHDRRFSVALGRDSHRHALSSGRCRFAFRGGSGSLARAGDRPKPLRAVLLVIMHAPILSADRDPRRRSRSGCMALSGATGRRGSRCDERQSRASATMRATCVRSTGMSCSTIAHTALRSTLK